MLDRIKRLYCKVFNHRWHDYFALKYDLDDKGFPEVRSVPMRECTTCRKAERRQRCNMGKLTTRNKVEVFLVCIFTLTLIIIKEYKLASEDFIQVFGYATVSFTALIALLYFYRWIKLIFLGE